MDLLELSLIAKSTAKKAGTFLQTKKSEKINSLASFNNENENMFVRDNTLNKLFENSKPLLTKYNKRLND